MEEVETSSSLQTPIIEIILTGNDRTLEEIEEIFLGEVDQEILHTDKLAALEMCASWLANASNDDEYVTAVEGLDTQGIIIDVSKTKKTKMAKIYAPLWILMIEKKYLPLCGLSFYESGLKETCYSQIIDKGRFLSYIFVEDEGKMGTLSLIFDASNSDTQKVKKKIIDLKKEVNVNFTLKMLYDKEYWRRPLEKDINQIISLGAFTPLYPLESINGGGGDVDDFDDFDDDDNDYDLPPIVSSKEEEATGTRAFKDGERVVVDVSQERKTATGKVKDSNELNPSSQHRKDNDPHSKLDEGDSGSEPSLPTTTSSNAKQPILAEVFFPEIGIEDARY